MVIDNETFTEMTLSLRRASDGLLDAARMLAALGNPDRRVADEGPELTSALEALVSMNREFVSVETILRSVWEANNSEGSMVC